MLSVARLSLKKRIFIALAAIAVIHAAFYAGPRWWYGRARVYPRGYDQAVAILREIFGDAAVDKGVVTIPRDKISVPYKGDGFAVRCCLRLDRDSATLLSTDFPKARVAHVKGKAARDLWAQWKYLENVRIETTDSRFLRDKARVELTRLLDRTWPWSGPLWPDYDYSPANDGESRALQEHLTALYIVELARFKWAIESPDISFTEDPEAIRPVVSALVRKYHTGPGPCHNMQLWPVYLEHLNERDLPFLKRLDKRAHKKAPEFLLSVPVIGSKLYRWFDARGLCFCGGIWEVEQLRGRSEAQRLAILKEAALAGGSEKAERIADGARTIFARAFPAQWRQFLMANCNKLNHYLIEKAIPEYGQAKSGDEEFLKLAMAKSEPLAQVRALKVLYGLTRKPSDFEAFMAAVSPVNFDAYYYPGDYGLSTLTEGILSFVEEDRDVGDARARILGLANDAWSASCKWSVEDKREFTFDIFAGMCRSKRDFARGFAEELLRNPEKVVPSGVPAEMVGDLQTAALTVGGNVSMETRLEYVPRFLTPDLSPKTADGIARGLAAEGDARVLPVLEALLANVTKHVESDPDSGTGPEIDHIRELILSVKLRSASDPRAFLRSLTADERAEMPVYAIRRAFTRQQVQELLVDESLKDLRSTIIRAIERMALYEFERKYPDAKTGLII